MENLTNMQMIIRTNFKRQRVATWVTLVMTIYVTWPSVQAYVSPSSLLYYLNSVRNTHWSSTHSRRSSSVESNSHYNSRIEKDGVSSRTCCRMSSLADPKTKTSPQESDNNSNHIKTSNSSRMDPTTKVYTMTSSQVETFISQGDRERLEASYGLLSEPSETLFEVSNTRRSTNVDSEYATTHPKYHKKVSSVAASSSLNKKSNSTITIHSSITNEKKNPKHITRISATSRRSSTMPGFNAKHTKRHRSFRDGLKIVQASNMKESKKIAKALQSTSSLMQRKQSNSDAMYVNSASVPDSMIAFTHEIHKESRITPEEEAELGMKTQLAISLQRIHSQLNSRFGREPTDEEWCAAAGKINMAALEAALHEGMEAKEKLIVSNLRMVQGVVNLYIRNGLGSQYNAGDLMQEGTLALIRAAEKFEPDRGFRFSTYAMYWIRAAVKRSQIFQSRVIEVPQRLHETHKKIVQIESQLEEESGRKPNKSELSLAVGITEKQLQRCKDAMEQQCFSLDAEIQNKLNPSKSDNKDTMYDILAATYDNVELQQIENDIMKQALIDTIRRYLSPIEVKLLLLRFGLMDERTVPYGFSGPLTIAEVSRLVELKPDKVRRMINKSLRHLRDLISHEWEDYELAK